MAEALLSAARTGDAATVASALQDGADIDMTLDEVCSLRWRCSEASSRLPLSCCGQDCGQWTPLHLLAADGDTEACKALLDAGASPSNPCVCGAPGYCCRCGGSFDHRWSSWILVRHSMGTRRYTLLLATATSPRHCASSRLAQVLGLLTRCGHVGSRRARSQCKRLIVCLTLQNGYTPLHYSAAFGHPMMAEMLIKRGAATTVEDSVRWRGSGVAQFCLQARDRTRASVASMAA